MKVKRESHRCRVAGNTVWSHIACDFPERCGEVSRSAILLLYFLHLKCIYFVAQGFERLEIIDLRWNQKQFELADSTWSDPHILQQTYARV